MNTVLKNNIESLFTNNKFNDIVTLTNTVIANDPLDLESRYANAIALFCSQTPVPALIQFIGIFNSYSLEQMAQDKTKKLFITNCAIQLILFGECFIKHLPHKIFGSAINICLQILKINGRDFNDPQLLLLAKSLEQRLLSSPRGEFFFRADSPRVLQIEPTNLCNLQCTMCSRNKITREKGFLKLDDFNRILSTWKNKFQTLSIPNLLFPENNLSSTFVMPGTIRLFFMGEPLLHKDIVSIINMAKKEKVNIGIETNGLLLKDPAIRDALLTAAPSAIGLSIDGFNKKTYEAIRKGGNWDQLKDAVIAFGKERRERGLEKSITIAVSSIVTDFSPQNRQAVFDFLEPLKPYINNFEFLPLDAFNNPTFINTEGELTAYQNALKPKDQREFICTEALEKMNVLWDGTITPCNHDINGDLQLGHINEGIDETWNNQKTKDLQLAIISGDITKFPLCSKCLQAV